MEEFDLAMDRKGFIAHRVLPVFETDLQAGSFGKIPIEQLLQTSDTKRSPGGGYSRGDYTFTKAAFSCEEHGHEEPVDDSERKMYANYFDLEQVSAARAYDAVLRNAEIRAAALLFNATTWASNKTTITHEWDDATNAVPLTDVETAVKAVWAASGLWPNALILNRSVFRNLRNCAQIIDRVKYSGFMDTRAGTITEKALAQCFDLEHVIVAGSPKNTAKEGQSVSLSSIWSDEYAMLARVAETNDIREPCVGRTLHWGEDGSQVGGTIETYRDETVRSDIVRCRHDVDELVTYMEAAHLFENVTTI
ncbi:MAG: hypothetical protein GY838_03950 [bacterium]|nr:hypothetical protein [bacterium]